MCRSVPPPGVLGLCRRYLFGHKLDLVLGGHVVSAYGGFPSFNGPEEIEVVAFLGSIATEVLHIGEQL
jgi:hypothetical protein